MASGLGPVYLRPPRGMYKPVQHCGRCTPQENVETVEDNVLLENIDIPLRYDDIDFRFDNLGAFANTAVNMIDTYILQTQEAALVGKVRRLIQENINSLIC